MIAKQHSDFFLDESSCGVLPLDQCAENSSHNKMRDILQEKHPEAAPLHSNILLHPDLQAPPAHAVLFNQIDGIEIQRMALRCRGAAGPSGLNAADRRSLCTKFQGPSMDLCNSLASLPRRISTEFVDPNGVASLMNCRLIPLDKNPGIQLIGICKTISQIRNSKNVIKSNTSPTPPYRQ